MLSFSLNAIPGLLGKMRKQSTPQNKVLGIYLYSFVTPLKNIETQERGLKQTNPILFF